MGLTDKERELCPECGVPHMGMRNPAHAPEPLPCVECDDRDRWEDEEMCATCLSWVLLSPDAYRGRMPGHD